MSKLLRSLSIAALLSLTVLSVRADHSLLEPHDSIVIAGDSITHLQLYVTVMEDYMLMCQPIRLTRIVNTGESGERAPGWLNRIYTVDHFHANVVTNSYGMNDGNYAALTPETANTYRTAQTGIVEALKKRGIRVIVLGSPKCVDTYYFHGGYGTSHTTAEVYNQTLSALSEIDRDVAQKEGVGYADVFGATMMAMQKSKAAYGENYNFGGPDGVHPGPNGAFVIAYALLKSLGFDGNIGTLTVDMARDQATGSPGQKVVSFQNGVLQVESTCYPFCFQGDPTKPEATDASIMRFVPFNDELNRYLLVVTGLTSAKAKVTWGTESKEFSADELKKGVNLAAEFLHNPFVDQFNKVDAVVQTFQNYDAGPPFSTAQALVVPVDHQLTIQAAP